MLTNVIKKNRRALFGGKNFGPEQRYQGNIAISE